jgi:hypothetical protein
VRLAAVRPHEDLPGEIDDRDVRLLGHGKIARQLKQLPGVALEQVLVLLERIGVEIAREREWRREGEAPGGE